MGIDLNDLFTTFDDDNSEELVQVKICDLKRLINDKTLAMDAAKSCNDRNNYLGSKCQSLEDELKEAKIYIENKLHKQFPTSKDK